jgi:hypothetical protein
MSNGVEIIIEKILKICLPPFTFEWAIEEDKASLGLEKSP